MSPGAGTTIFVASTGGHLGQLHELASRMGQLEGDRLWVTFESEQARTLLGRDRRIFIPYIAERDVRGVLHGTRLALRILREERRVRAVVSTGSAIALSFLPLAALRGIEAHYIESAARVSRPSLTGRILGRTPGVTTYRQYPHAAHGKWRYGGSVFEGFRHEASSARPVRRVVVTLGMEREFRRLLETLVRIIPKGVEVVWQTGRSAVDGLGIDPVDYMPAPRLAQAMRDADVVVAHAGCGSALAALGAGRCPILVPRNPAFGEVIDDHQAEIAEWLASRKLAVTAQAEALSWEDLGRAAGMSVARVVNPPQFQLATAA